MSQKNRLFLIDQIPKGKLGTEHFRLTEGPIPSPADGEVLLRVRYVSLDAANRAWMLGPTYRAALKAGDVMAGGALAEVVESRSDGFRAGDLVIGDTGWREYAAVPATTLMKVKTREPLSHACGGGIDVYFDNVGGETLDACLFGMKEHGRIAACGAVSRYDGAAPYGVQGTPAIISKRLTVRGFIVTDFFSQSAQALSDLEGWVRSGQLKVIEDIVDGFENLPAALVGLLAGENVGKRMVKVA